MARRYRPRRYVREPAVMVVELLDGTFHLEGRDWFFRLNPLVDPWPPDEMAAKIETLRRKWCVKQAEWVRRKMEG